VAWIEVCLVLIVALRKAKEWVTPGLDLADCCLRGLAAAEAVHPAPCAAAASERGRGWESVFEVEEESSAAAAG